MLTDMSKSCKYRLILSKIMNCQKLSDYLIFRRNILAARQLTIQQLSANCLDGLQMKGIVSKRIRDVVDWTIDCCHFFAYHPFPL